MAVEKIWKKNDLPFGFKAYTDSAKTTLKPLTDFVNIIFRIWTDAFNVKNYALDATGDYASYTALTQYSSTYCGCVIDKDDQDDLPPGDVYHEIEIIVADTNQSDGIFESTKRTNPYKIVQ